MHGWGWEYGDGWMPMGWMWMGGTLWIITIAVVVGLVVFAVKRFGAPQHGASQQRRDRTAVDLLEQAYARGDIKREEFLQKRADLLGS